MRENIQAVQETFNCFDATACGGFPPCPTPCSSNNLLAAFEMNLNRSGPNNVPPNQRDTITATPSAPIKRNNSPVGKQCGVERKRVGDRVC